MILPKNRIEEAKKAFADHGDPVAIMSDNITVIDYMRKDRSSDHYVRIVMIHDSGTLLITGDLGDCVAHWYGPLTFEQFIEYTNYQHSDYFFGKITASSVKYTYNDEDIRTDILEMKKEIVKSIVEDGEPPIKSFNSKIEKLIDNLTGKQNNLVGQLIIDDDAEKLFNELLGEDWWDSSYIHAGQRYHPWFYKWIAAMQNIGEYFMWVKRR